MFLKRGSEEWSQVTESSRKLKIEYIQLEIFLIWLGKKNPKRIVSLQEKIED